ncbi:MAG: LapA family protein [Thermodesulfobacteriota bacterium]
MKGSMLFLVILLALVALFAVQNPGIITVRFLTLTGETQLLVVIVASFAAGVLGAGFAALPGYFRRRSEVKALKAEIETLRRKAEPQKPQPPEAGGTA